MAIWTKPLAQRTLARARCKRHRRLQCAAKLARLVYRMLRYGMKYLDQAAECYNGQYRKQQVIHLKRKAAQLGFQIIEVAAAA